MTPPKPEQPKAVPRTLAAQPEAVRGNPQGQETTGGPTGQSTTGAKVEGQRTVVDPGADGVERAWGTPETGRLNR
jgi:hypothetical protein